MLFLYLLSIALCEVFLITGGFSGEKGELLEETLCEVPITGLTFTKLFVGWTATMLLYPKLFPRMRTPSEEESTTWIGVETAAWGFPLETTTALAGWIGGIGFTWLADGSFPTTLEVAFGITCGMGKGWSTLCVDLTFEICTGFTATGCEITGRDTSFSCWKPSIWKGEISPSHSMKTSKNKLRVMVQVQKTKISLLPDQLTPKHH